MPRPRGRGGGPPSALPRPARPAGCAGCRPRAPRCRRCSSPTSRRRPPTTGRAGCRRRSGAPGPAAPAVSAPRPAGGGPARAENGASSVTYRTPAHAGSAAHCACGGSAAGQNDQRIDRGAGQEVLPQPTFQPLAVLERVNEQDRAGNIQKVAGRALEVGRVSADESAVELDEQTPRRAGLVRHPPQQRRLADAAGPEHVERERRLRIAGQRLAEALELRLPADECPDAGGAQSLSHRHHDGSPVRVS